MIFTTGTDQNAMELLRQLCSIHAPSGNEEAMTDFLINYIQKHQSKWKVRPEIFYGEDFQNCIVLVFGKPKTAVYAHIDSIGYTVRYGNELVRIGSPQASSGAYVVGHDKSGNIEAELWVDKDEHQIRLNASRIVEPGTDLTYKPIWKEDEHFVQCCYMDNRLGVLNALNLCETLENGAIVFSCWEEHGGGSVAFLARFLYEKYGIKQALISDITWITEGVFSGKGVVISLRDSGLPRRKFIDRILKLAGDSGISFQKEVEGSGGSDGTEIQKQPYPIDWCFIGAGEENVHCPDERVNKNDIRAMFQMYEYLLPRL